MSLVGTLSKVALGVAAAKGIAHVAGKITQPTDAHLGGKGTGAGEFGSLLEQLATGAGASSSKATSASTGGLDALIPDADARAATKASRSHAPGEGSFAEVLNQSFQKGGEPKISPTPQQDAVAGLMLRAMLQAAKCDGRLDEGEKKKIVDVLGDASREEIAFVKGELAAPIDVQALVRQVPKGLETRIYAVSVMGIDLDSEKEAEYLAALTSALGIGSREANAIHAKMGIPPLFN